MFLWCASLMKVPALVYTWTGWSVAFSWSKSGVLGRVGAGILRNVLESSLKVHCTIEFHLLQNKYDTYNFKNLIRHLAQVLFFCLQWMLLWLELRGFHPAMRDGLADVTWQASRQGFSKKLSTNPFYSLTNTGWYLSPLPTALSSTVRMSLPIPRVNLWC